MISSRPDVKNNYTLIQTLTFVICVCQTYDTLKGQKYITSLKQVRGINKQFKMAVVNVLNCFALSSNFENKRNPLAVSLVCIISSMYTVS